MPSPAKPIKISRKLEKKIIKALEASKQLTKELEAARGIVCTCRGCCCGMCYCPLHTPFM